MCSKFVSHFKENELRKNNGKLESWDHHDILSVLPEYNSSGHCTTSARLRSIAPYSGRKETAVYATDVHTGLVIRCKVYIDNFSRIQIFHNSVKLDLDGLSTLRVRAFDNEGSDEMLKFTVYFAINLCYFFFEGWKCTIT
ncbi:hypothetical protein U1Q18_038312 [Sarracenia purpurea var. burkii]